MHHYVQARSLFCELWPERFYDYKNQKTDYFVPARLFS